VIILTYLPVLASIIAVVGILTFFKRNLEKIKENPEMTGKHQTNLFIGAAISEAIPIVLIIIGFVNMAPVGSVDELVVPFTIIIGLIVFAIIYIFLQSRIDVDENAKFVVRSFGIITAGLVNAIPIISLVMLIMMVPK
jgi:F0F1-type ATP synthase membrane subunit c/vacuolar-type H+-ATPase subunit K